MKKSITGILIFLLLFKNLLRVNYIILNFIFYYIKEVVVTEMDTKEVTEDVTGEVTSEPKNKIKFNIIFGVVSGILVVLLIIAFVLFQRKFVTLQYF